MYQFGVPKDYLIPFGIFFFVQCAEKDLQLDLSHFWKVYGIPEPVAEFKFHPKRRWKFDWAWVDRKIACEVDGGLWVAGGGRHNRPVTMIKDNEKFNNAALLGWRILKFTPQQFRNGEAAEFIKLIIE